MDGLYVLQEIMRIDIQDGDNAQFIELVQRVIDASVVRTAPDYLRVIRIDNWFGQRWRGFCGKLLGAAGVRRGRLAIPPFVPSRVDSESSWRRGDSSYIFDSEIDVLHKRISSEANLSRWFDQHCPNTIAVWFSSNTASNDRGAIMVYSDVGMDWTVSWYVELAETKNWKPTVANGITPSEFDSLTDLNQEEAEQAAS